MTRTRFGLVLGTAIIGITGLVGLTACARSGADTASPAGVVAGAVPAEMQALTTMGFDTGLSPAADPAGEPVVDPSPSASSPAKNRRNGLPLRRRLLRRNTLHGEFVVATKNGQKTVDVQRGAVTAIDDKTMTVKSTDGFTLTWTFGSPIHVLEHRTTVQPSAVKVGTQLGVAGTKSGATTTATLIVIG
jgi:hypothetical protein